MTGASPLTTVEWLAAHLDDPHVVVADARWYLQGKRGIDAYRTGHVPRAVFADVDGDLSSPKGAGRPGRHPLPEADHFADFLARIGVARGELVVAYDDSGGGTAARLWWLLRYFGHDGGRVLDGGIQAWTAAGHPLDTNVVERRPAEKMRLVPRTGMVVDKGRVRELSEGSRGTLLDARASERFEGTVEPVDARPGHIPGAKNAPFAGNLEAPGGRFLPASTLGARFAALGAGGAAPVVAYCGSGVTACQDLLALSLAGHDDALLYEGSWSDWAADLALPAAVGKG